MRQNRRRLTRRIEDLEIAARRVESAAETVTATAVEITAPIEPMGADSLRRFEWSDEWVRVSGTLSPDGIVCSVASVDTLLQVVHRVPYRWWFLRWGTKAVRQTVSSSNPHTRVVYTEYIELR